MLTLRCGQALLPSGWVADVELDLGLDGRIEQIRTPDGEDSETLELPLGPRIDLPGLVIPGMANAHSHAFQRALVGRAEVGPRGAPDSFWSWREAMYGVAADLDEPTLEAIARQLFVEMLEAGYTGVGEFHYLHNRPDGHAYVPPGRLGHALLRAAAEVGLSMTLLPVLYLHGGFDQLPSERQRRFTHRSLLGFGRLLESLGRALEPGQRLGVAPHSLRAVDPESLRAVVALADEQLGPDAPIHIHVSEQTDEVSACIAALGTSPIAALAQTVELGPRWCLVHATHATEAELRAIRDSGAVIALCPTTEANLGDGRFPLAGHVEAGGRMAIGTDSQVTVDPAEELRWLEYQARLESRSRNVLQPSGEHLGAHLWQLAASGGARALGTGTGEIRVGARADLVELDPDHPRLVGLSPDAALDAHVLGARALRSVVVGGQMRVREGRHPRRDEIAAAYRAAIRRL